MNFKNKQITMMGLGLLGRGVGVAKYLLSKGAVLTITDLKSREKLKASVKQLKPYKKQITYVLGRHRLEDFRNRDMIIKAAGVPLKNKFIDEARKNGIRVEMDASLFARLVPDGVTLIGITGTKGKSTVTHLIYHILQTARVTVYLGGNVRGVATLPLLDKVKKGDCVVLELDSWQLQGFGDAKISPHIAVFTNLMADHLGYYGGSWERYFADKANIYMNQKKDDFLIITRQIMDRIKKTLSKKIVVTADDLAKDWKLRLVGEHNRENAALAVEACRVLDIEERVIRKALISFAPVEGRLEYLGSKDGVSVYNDNNATVVEATVAGMRAVVRDKNVVLITGGTDKGLPVDKFPVAIEKYCTAVILVSGTGTERVNDRILALPIQVKEEERLECAFREAVELARNDDVILFSPAFASFSKYFNNEYERNDLFVREVKKWLSE